jgi:transposase
MRMTDIRVVHVGMKFVGVDVAKHVLVACALGEDRVIVVENNEEGYEKILQTFGTNIIVGIENTGIYHIPLIEYLTKRGIEVRTLNPLEISRMKGIRGKKSDNTDAKNIATQIMIGSGCKVVEHARRLKELVSRYWFLRSMQIRLQNRIIRDLDMVSSYEGGLNKGFVERLANGDFSSLRLRGLSFEDVVLEDVRVMALELLRVMELKRRVEEEIAAVVPRDHVIFTVPGIGPLTGAMILARVGDVRRFPSPGKFVAYCGLDPVVVRSGASVSSGGISKRGDRVLRTAFYLAALSGMRVNPLIKSYAAFKRSRGFRGRELVVVCARKLARVVWAVWYKNEPFKY